MLFIDFLLVSPTWDTHKSKAVIGGANEPWTFARIMEADVGLTECTERNVVQFLAAVCGKERCVTTEYKKKKTA